MYMYTHILHNVCIITNCASHYKQHPLQGRATTIDTINVWTTPSGQLLISFFSPSLPIDRAISRLSYRGWDSCLAKSRMPCFSTCSPVTVSPKDQFNPGNYGRCFLHARWPSLDCSTSDSVIHRTFAFYAPRTYQWEKQLYFLGFYDIRTIMEYRN